MAAPTYDLSWAAATPASSTEPSTAKKAQGWLDFEPLPAANLNWWWVATASWMQDLAEKYYDSGVTLPGSWTGQGEHNEDGTHGDVTADSLDVSGNAAVDGVLTTRRGSGAGASAVQVGGTKTSTVADGSAVTGTAAETVLHNTVLLADDLQAGSVVHMRASVKMTADGGGGFTLRGRINGLTGVLCWSFQPPAAATGTFIILDWYLTCRTDGATGTVASNMTLLEKTSTTVTPDAAHAVPGTTVDTTGTLSFVLTCQLGSGASSVATEQVIVEFVGKN